MLAICHSIKRINLFLTTRLPLRVVCESICCVIYYSTHDEKTKLLFHRLDQLLHLLPIKSFEICRLLQNQHLLSFSSVFALLAASLISFLCVQSTALKISFMQLICPIVNRSYMFDQHLGVTENMLIPEALDASVPYCLQKGMIQD